MFEHPRGRLRGAIGEASGDIVFRDRVPDSSPTGPILIALSIGGLRKDVVP